MLLLQEVILRELCQVLLLKGILDRKGGCLVEESVVVQREVLIVRDIGGYDIVELWDIWLLEQGLLELEGRGRAADQASLLEVLERRIEAESGLVLVEAGVPEIRLSSSVEVIFYPRSGDGANRMRQQQKQP